MDAAVLREAGFIQVGADRLVLSKADDRDGIADSQLREDAADFQGPFLPQDPVVFRASPLVGVALDGNRGGRVLLEEFGLCREGVLGLIRQRPLVEVEVDVLEALRERQRWHRRFRLRHLGNRWRRALGFRRLLDWRRQGRLGWHTTDNVSPMDGVRALHHVGGRGPRLQPDDFDLGEHLVRVLGHEGEPAARPDHAEAVSQRDAVRLTPVDVDDFRLRGYLARLLEVHDHSGEGPAGRLPGRNLWGELERHHKIARRDRVEGTFDASRDDVLLAFGRDLENAQNDHDPSQWRSRYRMVDLLGGAVESESVADLHVRVRRHPDVEDIAQPEELFGFARANYEAGDLLGELDVPALKGDGWVACQGQSWRCRSVCSKTRSGGSCRKTQPPCDD